VNDAPEQEHYEQWIESVTSMINEEHRAAEPAANWVMNSSWVNVTYWIFLIVILVVLNMGVKISTPWVSVKFRAANPSDAEKIAEFVEQNNPAELYEFVSGNDELQNILDGIPFPTDSSEVPQFAEALTPDQGSKIVAFIAGNSQQWRLSYY